MVYLSGGLIGGSFIVGFFVFCLLMYIIFRFLRLDIRIYLGNYFEIVICVEVGVFL